MKLLVTPECALQLNKIYTFAHLKHRLNNEKNNTKMQKFLPFV